MEKEVKKQIQITLSILKEILVDNEVSIGFDKDSKKIMFFDTRDYVDNNNFNGFSVDMNSLVK